MESRLRGRDLPEARFWITSGLPTNRPESLLGTPCSSHAGITNAVWLIAETYTLRAVGDQCVHDTRRNVRT